MPRLGIHVSDGRLVETDGADLVLRGINHGLLWYPGRTAAFADIKATGANTIRVPLSIGKQWPATGPAEVASIVRMCKRSRLICVLDAHDTVGYGQQPGAATLAQAVDYWLRLRPVLVGTESYVIVNVADEPYGLNLAKRWPAETTEAVRRLRQAGYLHALMVDAPDWGQDDTGTMRDHAAAVLAADPRGNTVFSIHMYGVYSTPYKVQTYLAAYVQRRLPIVVGEFVAVHDWGDPDEDAILTYCRYYLVGYLGWSWSGNQGLDFMDLVRDFDPKRRTPWGVRLIAGVDGIATTSREADVFSRD